MNSIPTLLILIWVCLRLPLGLLLPGKPLARILAATSLLTVNTSQYVLEKGKEAGKSLAVGN
ncbi:hypothetical protein GLYMA_20G087951v4 [Glycine max]|nr:hypothetical protein GLYMA_20G087951v4 [Glycine max]